MSRVAPRCPARSGVGLVLAYRYTLGVLFPALCKYHPSCSQYAIDALREYGLVRGSVLAGWRLLRCQPVEPRRRRHGRGPDALPEREEAA